MRYFPLIPLLAGIALLGAPAHSAIFASDVEVGGSGPAYTVFYLLNETAVSGSISVSAAATPGTVLSSIPLTGAQLAQGYHDVQFTPPGLAAGNYVFKVNVTAAPHTGYDVIVPPTTVPGALTLSYAVKSNRVVGSPGYGHFYTADYTAHQVHEMDALGRFVQSIGVPATGGFTPVGLTFDTNGDYYITDQNIDHIYQYHATGTTSKPTWNQAADFTGVILDEAPNFGSFLSRGLQVFGAGADATVYLAAYNPVPNPVLRGKLGDTVTPVETLFTGTAIAGTRIDQVLVSPDQKTIFVSSGAAGTSHLNKYIFGVNPATTLEEWYLDPDFSQNSTDTATLSGLSRGLTFAAGGDALWVTQSKSGGGQDVNYVARVSLLPSPTDPATAARVLRIAGGLQEIVGDTFPLDDNLDGSVDILDAVTLIRHPAPAGSIVQRIPAPIPEGGTLPVLPFTLDTDPKGNLIVGANTNNAGSAIVGQAFYIVAPPDNGSSDSAASAVVTVS
jgi:hypothetical protein